MKFTKSYQFTNLSYHIISYVSQYHSLIPVIDFKCFSMPVCLESADVCVTAWQPLEPVEI